MVAVKGDNLSILEAENIGRGNIDHLARGSDSLGTNGQLTVMRSPNSMLDDHDVTRDVNARYLTADIWKSTCKGGNRVPNGLSAKLRARPKPYPTCNLPPRKRRQTSRGPIPAAHR